MGNTRSHMCCSLHAVPSAKGSQRGYEGSTLNTHLWNFNRWSGAKKKVTLTFRMLSGGERGYLRLPPDINFSAKSVIRTLMLCGVNTTTHHGCGTKEHPLIRPAGARVVQVCPFSTALPLLARHAAHKSHNSPVQACYATGRGLQGGEAQTASVRTGW